MDIKKRRMELKLTLKEVANYVGVAEATVSRWETGNIKNMKRDKMFLLAKVLHISPFDLTDIVFDEDNKIISQTKSDVLKKINSLNEEELKKLLGVINAMFD